MTLNLNTFDLFNPTEEHILIRKNIRQFVKDQIEPGALSRDKDEYFDLTLFKKLGKLGILGVTASSEYGGSDLDITAALIIHEELSYSDPGFCLAYLAHSMLCVNNISVNCNTQQKKKYLPNLSSGKWIGAMAISEPSSGTDVLNMKTSAKKVNGGYLINGRKMWITNGIIDKYSNTADCIYLYAKTGKTISTFLIDKNTPGFFAGQLIKGKLGMRASSTAELVFDNCFVKDEQLVGTEGSSLKHMMKNLEIERLTLASMSLGIGRRALKIMNDYANERTAFNKKISSFGQIQRYIADSYSELNACRTYTYNTARMSSLSNGNYRLDSDGSKLLSSTIAKNICDRAIQVLGGNGYISEYIVERLWRDSKLLEIGGGTIEAHQKNIKNDLSNNLDILLN